jgi:hypothetical protein
MAVTILNPEFRLEDDPITIRPGDVVFQYKEGSPFPLHAGVYIGVEQIVRGPLQHFRVRGLPGHEKSRYLGDSTWGEAGAYQVHIIGQRRDVDPIHVKQVVHLANVQLYERPQIGRPCEWVDCKRVKVDFTRTIGDGIPVFVKGTCAQFVEFLYEIAELELIGTERARAGSWPAKFTCDPSDPRRIYPATQIHVFWTGSYGLRSSWDSRYTAYPDCLFGNRSEI